MRIPQIDENGNIFDADGKKFSPRTWPVRSHVKQTYHPAEETAPRQRRLKKTKFRPRTSPARDHIDTIYHAREEAPQAQEIFSKRAFRRATLGQPAGPPDFYPKDPKTSAYAIALETGKPTSDFSFVRKFGNPASQVYPSQFVVLKPDSKLMAGDQLFGQAFPRTVFVIGFRPPAVEEPPSVRLLSLEGKRIGSYVTVTVAQLMSEFLVVPSEPEKAFGNPVNRVQRALPPTPQPWIDGKPQNELPTSLFVSTLLSQTSFNISMIPFTDDIDEFALQIHENRALIMASLAAVHIALDMTGAAYDFNNIGRKAMNIYICVGGDIYLQLMGLLENMDVEGPNSILGNQEKITALQAQIEKVLDRANYWELLIARASMLTEITVVYWLMTNALMTDFVTDYNDTLLTKLKADPEGMAKTMVGKTNPDTGQTVTPEEAKKLVAFMTQHFQSAVKSDKEFENLYKKNFADSFYSGGLTQDDVYVLFPTMLEGLKRNKSEIIKAKKALTGSTYCPEDYYLAGPASHGLGTNGVTPKTVLKQTTMGERFRDSALTLAKTLLRTPGAITSTTMRTIQRKLNALLKQWETLLVQAKTLEVESREQYDQVKRSLGDQLTEARKAGDKKLSDRLVSELRKYKKKEHLIEMRDAWEFGTLRLRDRIGKLQPIRGEKVEAAEARLEEHLPEIAEILSGGSMAKVDPSGQVVTLNMGSAQFIRPKGFWTIMKVLQKQKLVHPNVLPDVAGYWLSRANIPKSYLIKNLERDIQRNKDAMSKPKITAEERDKLKARNEEFEAQIKFLKHSTEVTESQVIRDLEGSLEEQLDTVAQRTIQGMGTYATSSLMGQAHRILALIEYWIAKADPKALPEGGTFRAELAHYKNLQTKGEAFTTASGRKVLEKFEKAIADLEGADRGLSAIVNRFNDKVMERGEAAQVEAKPILLEMQNALKTLIELRAPAAEARRVSSQWTARFVLAKLNQFRKKYVEIHNTMWNRMLEMAKEGWLGKLVFALLGLPTMAVLFATEVSIVLLALVPFGFPMELLPINILKSILGFVAGVGGVVADFTRGDENMNPFADPSAAGAPGLSPLTKVLIVGLGISMIFAGDKVFPAFTALFQSVGKAFDSVTKIFTKKPKKVAGRGPGRPRKEPGVAPAVKGIPPEVLGYILGGK
jgi:hypothetical protein